MRELTECNREVAAMHEWPKQAGELAMLEKRYDRMFKAALRTTEGANADIRKATAHAAVEAAHHEAFKFSISERIEELTGDVVTGQRTMDMIGRRSGNVQSILKARRDERGLDRYVAPS